MTSLSDKEIYSRLGLHLTEGIGPSSARRLMDLFGSAGEILAAGPAEVAARGRLAKEVTGQLPTALDRAEAELARLEKMGGWALVLDQEGYPKDLAQIHDPPLALFGLGNREVFTSRALAIVGSRKATDYGLTLTIQLAGELAMVGICVVSGLAQGIDSAAHKGALNSRGETVAVTGCGLDINYPRENAFLRRDILRNDGTILSEYPLGSEPAPWHFPVRNRIIAGLSRGVIVAEASPKSGSLITARLAADYGRTVMAVPGPVNEDLRIGTHRLIREGAVLITTGAEAAVEIWPELGLEPLIIDTNSRRNEAEGLDGDGKRIYRLLETTPRHVDDIIRESAMEASPVMGILLDLELKGLAKRLPGQMYIRR